MENMELKRANDLKEIELKLYIWKELYGLGKVKDKDYIDVLKYGMDALNGKEGRD